MAHFYKGNLIGFENNSWTAKDGEQKQAMNMYLADVLEGDKLHGRKPESFFVMSRNAGDTNAINTISHCLGVLNQAKPSDIVLVEYDEAKTQNGVFKNIKSVEIMGAKK